ncbi:sugar ABC transporter ATP-binding protein [Consotaella salsifontis]|uniref:Monosaccharide ABC transporter ATP-binding protein, CUT2 family n=1 Tax=Consotaella salsifontis TaxID=1365950 RepID=A0A1T4LHK5_9HYPH|nr:sugar ABC transporter ATP-binding protein [Consotaella salsifontis]SJZ54170.1 monosaccharide ABC transporter ATP-binding protein, CUT2 family [Consotaella salsifontis]
MSAVISGQAARIPEGEVADPILKARGVVKRFPGVLALNNIQLELRRGEVHALCGENGAGKSTLMKVVTGQLQPDEGEVTYKGQPVHFDTLQDSEAAGITMIHQELNLVPHLTVAENIFLAREPKKGWFVDRKKMEADAQIFLDRLKVNIKASDLVLSLSVARQQMVEIAKALSLNAEVLIMDEPTSALTESEIDQLFAIIHELKRQGVAIAYISHRLQELGRIVDRVTVMRDGGYVWTKPFDEVTVDDIVAAMVGRSLEQQFPERVSTPTDELIFEVRNLSGVRNCRNVNFTLRRGEILGFAGLMGAGRTETARAIFGADPKTGGEVLLEGEEITIASPVDAIKAGIAYLAEDRKLNGLSVKMTVKENITMANIEAVVRHGLIDKAAEAQAARQSIAKLGIKTPSIDQVVRNLSGGNQQKVVIGKWLFRESRVLFFDEPTRGIDVGAKFAIYQLLDQLASEGIGVVMITSELPEILGMTDRVVVFHEGEVSGILETRKTDQEEIMQYASGVKRMSL